MGKRKEDQTLGSRLKIDPGLTTCVRCNRAMREEDVDDQGLCPDEACQATRAPEQRAE